jgi:hypothetical protein
MTVPIRINDRFEVYRVVMDYEALQDGFADRIEDLNTTLTEIDTAAGLTQGLMQRLINTNPEEWRPKGKRKQSRQFAWKTLSAALKGTGMALVLVVDDERFAATKDRLAKRRRARTPAIAGSRSPSWLFAKDKAREMGKKRFSLMTDAQRKRHQRKAGRASGKARRLKAKAGALLASATAASCADGQSTPHT